MHFRYIFPPVHNSSILRPRDQRNLETLVPPSSALAVIGMLQPEDPHISKLLIDPLVSVSSYYVGKRI